jgi:hypothetical protein
MQATGANTRHTITISYVFSALVGMIIFSPEMDQASKPWFWVAAFEGAAFYLVFRLIARTTQVNGIAVTSIATKSSVVIPITIGIVILGESFTV